MSGFKNSTRMRSGFDFSKGAGFTASTGKVQNISYTRKTPHRGKATPKFAEGGRIDSSLHSFKQDSALNVEHGPTGGLRPGFIRGGSVAKYAKGGRIPESKMAAKAVAKHVAAPAPKGHKGLGAKLKGC